MKSEGKLFGPRSKTMAGADAIAAALDREALLEYLDTQIYV